LAVTVSEVTPEVAADLLDKQPELAKDRDSNRVLDRDSAIRRLRQFALVDIWERCRFEEINPTTGTRIAFAARDQSEVPVAEPVNKNDAKPESQVVFGPPQKAAGRTPKRHRHAKKSKPLERQSK